MTPDFVTVETRAPVRVTLPTGEHLSDAQLYLGTIHSEPRVLVYVRHRQGDPTPGPATLTVDQPWDVAGSLGLPNRGQTWQIATPLGPLLIEPVRGCASCGGRWWTRHHPFPDMRGPTLRRFLEQRRGWAV